MLPRNKTELTLNSSVIGWGLKENTRKVRECAKNTGLPYWQLEDGFISYLGHPSLGDRRFSLIVDKTGIYYDATKPSDLENLLNNKLWVTWDLLQRSRNLLDTICHHQISKYNHEPVGSYTLPASDKPRVLVVDQTFGDCSIQYGMANASSFQGMLDAALTENPEAEVWVKVHPDVVLGKKKGYLGNNLPKDNPRIKVLAEKVNAQSLFPWFSKVYVVTSQLGFEALWHRKEVVCFGVPFYSGWGLTDDRVPCPRRNQIHTVESLFAAACLLYTRYIDPETAKPCELEDVLELIALQKRYQHQEVNTLYLVGFSLWKRAFMKTFVGGLAQQVKYVKSPAQASRLAKSGDGILIWGAKQYDYEPPSGVKLYRCEDAFVRGVGLGAELKRPQSLVLDGTGIYFDCSQPSDLERAINTQKLTEAQIKQGKNIREQLVTRRISKYNLRSGSKNVFANVQAGQKKILVTGQVDSDASIQYGSPEIRSNHALLVQVRKNNPDAYIVYKPHPDVVQAGRAGYIPDEEALKWADAIAVDSDIFDCIAQCDEVHVLTSLAGFEAVIQGKTVHTWGCPFYSSWGVTVDHCSCDRRQARRTVDELVYFAYIAYSRYVNWDTRRFTTLERFMKALENASPAATSKTGISRWCSRKKRKIGYLAEALFQ